MTLQEFINTWDGKKLEFDGAYLYQCVDLAKAWNAALGYPGRRGNGKDWINNAGNEYVRIDYKPGLVPQEGDIVSWSGSLPGSGGYGHVAVAISGNANGFTSFDQNWPVNSPCHRQFHNYNYVLGWIRPKTYQGGEDVSIIAAKDAEIANLKNAINLKDQEITNLKSSHFVAENPVKYSDGQLRDAATWLLAFLNTSIDKEALEKAVKDLQGLVEETSNEVIKLNKIIVSKDKEIEDIKKSKPTIDELIISFVNWLSSVIKNLKGR